MGLKKQVLKKKDGEVVAVFGSAVEAAKDANVEKCTICRRCTNGKELNGFTYEYSGEVTNKWQETQGDFKCPYCDRSFQNYNGLAKHVVKNKAHGHICNEKLLTDFKYGGVRPTCACGCGRYTRISYDSGEATFRDYVQGHQSRVHNNWGHNEKAKEHSAQTRREQYESGGRVQWNKGLTWDKTYTEDKIAKLREIIYTKERADKIRNALSGVSKSEEHRQKLVDRMYNGEFKVASNAEWAFIEDFIEPLGVMYIHQKYVKEIRQLFDVYIPSKDVYIEFDGDFWHCNPEKYPNGPINEAQRNRIEKDKIKNEWAERNGKKLLRFWESDVRDNPEMVVETLKQEILQE